MSFSGTLSSTNSGIEHDPVIGEIVGSGHRVVERMANAPFGALYLAEASKNDRLFVRLLPSRFGASPEVMHALDTLCGAAPLSERFVQTRQVGVTSEGIPFLLADHFEGQTLWGYVSGEATLNVADAIKIGADVAAALEELHSVGRVHGGLAPRCVLRSPWGTIKLGDPGLVPLLQSFEVGTPIERIIRDEECLVDPSFLPPEVLSGAPPSVASDLYGLGLLLFYTLTGRPAFSVPTNLETAQAQLLGRVESLSDAAPLLEVPTSLSKLIAELLAERPSDRPSASDVGRRLSALWRDAASRVAASGDDDPTNVRVMPEARRTPKASVPEVPHPSPSGRRWLTLAVWSVSAVLLAITTWLAYLALSR